MDTLQAFIMREANRRKELMVFDWDKAATLIKERHPNVVDAGLRGDWENTGGCIYEYNQPVMNAYTYLASTWAVPEICIDDGEFLPCYRMQSETPGWNSKTRWPKSALDILEGLNDAERR